MNTEHNPDADGVLATIKATLEGWPKSFPLEPDKELELRGKLALKLSKAYAEIDAVAKTGRNDTHKYNFASADDVFAVCRSGMNKVGLAILPVMGAYTDLPIWKIDNKGNETAERRGAYVVCEFDFCLIDTDTGYTVPIPWRGEVMEYGDKAFNKAATNATKYALRTLFLLPTDASDDPDSYGEEGRPATTQAGQNTRSAQKDKGKKSEPKKQGETAQELTEAELITREFARKANAMLGDRGLNGGDEGFAAFKELALGYGVAPLRAFVEIGEQFPEINLWPQFINKLQAAHEKQEETAPESPETGLQGSQTPEEPQKPAEGAQIDESTKAVLAEAVATLAPTAENAGSDASVAAQRPVATPLAEKRKESKLRLLTALAGRDDYEELIGRLDKIGVVLDDMIEVVLTSNLAAQPDDVFERVERIEAGKRA